MQEKGKNIATIPVLIFERQLKNSRKIVGR